MRSQSLLFSSTTTDIFPEYFTLSVTCHKDNTNITMHVLTEQLTTDNMMSITHLLKVYLPTILQSKCFNEKNLPFYREVAHTEIGHLFEHILLEYLCREKLNTGEREAMFSGVTKWNWNKDTLGTFHIEVDVSESEKEILYFALEQSKLLLKRILHYHLLPHIFEHPLSVPSFSFAEKQMA